MNSLKAMKKMLDRNVIKKRKKIICKIDMYILRLSFIRSNDGSYWIPSIIEVNDIFAHDDWELV